VDQLICEEASKEKSVLAHFAILFFLVGGWLLSSVVVRLEGDDDGGGRGCLWKSVRLPSMMMYVCCTRVRPAYRAQR
jgi:hypothetical protein